MAEAGEKIEVKTLKNTDLKPEDISKAIDDSAKVLGGKTKSEPAKAAVKPAKKEAGTKPAAKAAASKDEGSQIIVKKRNSYVGPAATAASDAKPAENLSQEAKVELKPPSEHGKAVVAPTAASEQTAETEAEDKTEDPAPAPAATKPAETAPEPKVEPLAPAQPAKMTASKSDQAESPPDQQTLKTFDTTQYHLPIKPTAGKHYLNSVVSWTILILVFVGVGGYVLNELEVIDLSQFGL